MKVIELKELKKIELNLLKQVHAFCEKENLRYFLAGGTLLGAVRHKGFIPWDDDIDIAMPRPDYDKFIQLCKEKCQEFKVASFETQSKYTYTFAKVYDQKTTIKEKIGNRNDFELGVYIDVFPLDGVGETTEDARKIIKKTKFKRELLVAYNWKKFSRSKTRAWYYEPIRFAFYLLSRFVKSEKMISKLQKQFRSNSFENSKYVAAIMGAYREKEITDAQVFSSSALLQFENSEFHVPIKYKEWLTQIYGDYMTLPPKEKQITHHTFDAYYLD